MAVSLEVGTEGLSAAAASGRAAARHAANNAAAVRLAPEAVVPLQRIQNASIQKGRDALRRGNRSRLGYIGGRAPTL